MQDLWSELKRRLEAGELSDQDLKILIELVKINFEMQYDPVIIDMLVSVDGSTGFPSDEA